MAEDFMVENERYNKAIDEVLLPTVAEAREAIHLKARERTEEEILTEKKAELAARVYFKAWIEGAIDEGKPYATISLNKEGLYDFPHISTQLSIKAQIVSKIFNEDKTELIERLLSWIREYGFSVSKHNEGLTISWGD